jgi:hypothetical protein
MSASRSWPVDGDGASLRFRSPPLRFSRKIRVRPSGRFRLTNGAATARGLLKYTRQGFMSDRLTTRLPFLLRASVRRHRRAQGGSSTLQSIRPKRATRGPAAASTTASACHDEPSYWPLVVRVREARPVMTASYYPMAPQFLAVEMHRVRSARHSCQKLASPRLPYQLSGIRSSLDMRTGSMPKPTRRAKRVQTIDVRPIRWIEAGYARIPLTTFPWTFVSRRRMPSW